jgi:hypothetical protein
VAPKGRFARTAIAAVIVAASAVGYLAIMRGPTAATGATSNLITVTRYSTGFGYAFAPCPLGWFATGGGGYGKTPVYLPGGRTFANTVGVPSWPTVAVTLTGPVGQKPVTTLHVTPLMNEVLKGDQVTLTYLGRMQTFTAAATSGFGATVITVDSRSPNYPYPASMAVVSDLNRVIQSTPSPGLSTTGADGRPGSSAATVPGQSQGWYGFADGGAIYVVCTP